jgi:acyl-coenzyme A synthetase/AMP-(fatty) acid ligase
MKNECTRISQHRRSLPRTPPRRPQRKDKVAMIFATVKEPAREYTYAELDESLCALCQAH